VRGYATEIARHAGVAEEALLQAIEVAALLHDVGKLALPDSILNKPGPLTAEEYEHVKEHASIGAALLADVDCPPELAPLVRHHHENWDGSGYPEGLSREEIPFGARILAVADCYDALTSHRPYRRALSHDSAMAMIHERRGSMFDPQVTDAFLQVVWRLHPSTGIYRRIERPRPARALVLVGAGAR
jgi:putative nucleotidyltransferase with HDIG domain